MDNDTELRTQLANLLTVRQAHAGFGEAVANFPEEHINATPPNCNYSFWQLLEHLRICQKDILDYIEAADYKWLTFPDDLWPEASATTDVAGWNRSIDQFLADRQRLADIVHDPDVDLFAPLPNSGERRHTILREINVAAGHNSYHIGGLVIMRQSIGSWP